jgi:hypothetical protein
MFTNVTFCVVLSLALRGQSIGLAAGAALVVQVLSSGGAVAEAGLSARIGRQQRSSL